MQGILFYGLMSFGLQASPRHRGGGRTEVRAFRPLRFWQSKVSARVYGKGCNVFEKLVRFLPLSAIALLSWCSNAGAALLPTESQLGLAAGEQYAFVFVTSGTITASSSSLSTYNTFVQNAADAASIGTSIGRTWKAMVNTGISPNRAIDNAPVASNVKVFRIDGVMVANGSTSPFYHFTVDHLAPINYTELGTTVSRNVWTGGWANGTESGSGLLGTSATPVFGESGSIGAAAAPGGWARAGNQASGTSNSLYALSNVMTAIPEPSSLALVGIAGLPLLKRRRAR